MLKGTESVRTYFTIISGPLASTQTEISMHSVYASPSVFTRWIAARIDFWVQTWTILILKFEDK